MIKLHIIEQLKKKGKSKYWLREQMNISNGKNFDNFVHGKTTAISYKYINELCRLLECTPGDLMSYIPEKEKESV